MDRTTDEGEESCKSAEDDVFLSFSTSYFTLPTDWAHKFYVDDTLIYGKCLLEVCSDLQYRKTAVVIAVFKLRAFLFTDIYGTSIAV
jgi:hypothetical protein